MLPSSSRFTSFIVHLLSLFAQCRCIHSKHVHHRPVHKHLHRAETPTPTSSSRTPLYTSVGVPEIQQFSKDIDRISEDIESLLATTQNRLSEIEKVLSDILAGTRNTTTSTSSDNSGSPRANMLIP